MASKPNQTTHEELDPAAIAALKSKGDRVDFICDLMRALRFERGKTHKQLAQAWGVSASTVRDYTSEASRIVKAEVTDKDGIERDVGATLVWAMRSAVEAGDRRNAIAAARTAAEVSGVKAAERHEVTTTEATPENARRLMAEKFGKLTPTGSPSEAEGEDSAETSGSDER